MSCAADRDGFAPLTGNVADQREGITPEVNGQELADRLLVLVAPAYDKDIVRLWLISELEKALDQEYRRGAKEARQAIGTALRYRPISPDETR